MYEDMLWISKNFYEYIWITWLRIAGAGVNVQFRSGARPLSLLLPWSDSLSAWGVLRLAASACDCLPPTFRSCRPTMLVTGVTCAPRALQWLFLPLATCFKTRLVANQESNSESVPIPFWRLWNIFGYKSVVEYQREYVGIRGVIFIIFFFIGQFKPEGHARKQHRLTQYSYGWGREADEEGKGRWWPKRCSRKRKSI